MSEFSQDIRYRNILNPSIFDRNDNMLPEVRKALLGMAREFRDYIGIDDLDVIDVTLSGSNAGYNYTKYSDIDLHLIVKTPKQDKILYKELFDAKRYLYNTVHDQRIRNIKVEFYVEDVNERVKSKGIYSVLRNEWIYKPNKTRDQYDGKAVKDKVELFTRRIKYAMRDNNYELVNSIWDDLKRMRKSGLERAGEFSTENLAYKILRNRNLVTDLIDRINYLRDKELSLESITEDDFDTDIVPLITELFEPSEIKSTTVETDKGIVDSFTHEGSRYDIHFEELEPDHIHLYFTKDNSTITTGDNIPFYVLGEVVNSVRRYARENGPKIVEFSSKGKKGALFQNMVKKYKPEGYSLSFENYGNDTIGFTLRLEDEN